MGHTFERALSSRCSAKHFVRLELSMNSNGSLQTKREKLLYSGVKRSGELDTWLLIERDKEKLIEQTKVPMCRSTRQIWHIHCVKRRQSSALMICIALVFYIGRLFWLSYGRRKSDSFNVYKN